MPGWCCRCGEAETRLVRVISRDGRSSVEEQCTVCGGNARGVGRWVPAREVAVPVASLPVARDLRTAEDRGEQPGLFTE